MTPVDLLAGLAPGVELFADDVPPGIAGDDHADSPLPANTTVTEVGRQVRAGEGTVRRLIRTAVLRPATRGVDGEAESAGAEPTRAGVIDRTPDKPGE